MAAGGLKMLKFQGGVQATSCSAHCLQEGKGPGVQVSLRDRLGSWVFLPSPLLGRHAGVLGSPSFPAARGGMSVSARTAWLGRTQSILPHLRSLHGPGEIFSEEKGVYPSRQRPYQKWWLKATIRQI